MSAAQKTPEEVGIENAIADAKYWASYDGGKPHPRQEIEAALDDYGARFNSGDIAHWAEILSPDVLYVDGHFGVFHGRKAVREWASALSTGQTALKFVSAWYMIDGNVVVNFNWGRFPNPDGSYEPYDSWRKPGGSLDKYPYQFQNLSILVYGGDGMFCYEQDFYSAPAYTGIMERWNKQRGQRG